MVATASRCAHKSTAVPSISALSTRVMERTSSTSAFSNLSFVISRPGTRTSSAPSKLKSSSPQNTAVSDNSHDETSTSLTNASDILAICTFGTSASSSKFENSFRLGNARVRSAIEALANASLHPSGSSTIVASNSSVAPVSNRPSLLANAFAPRSGHRCYLI